MDFKELCAELAERETRVQYWRNTLKKFGLIDPKKGLGNKDIYSESDVEMFKKVQQYLKDGVPTVTDACQMIANNITPDMASALRTQLERANRQIEVLHMKVLQLRKPFWKRVVDWFKGLFARGLSQQTE